MIRLLILSNIRLYCDGLTELLDREPDFQIIRNHNNYSDPGEITNKLNPDAVLLDMNMNDPLLMTKSIAALSLNTNLIALGISNDNESILKFAEMGIAGYVTKDDSFSDLKKVIKYAVRGEFHCNPRTTRSLIRHISSLASQSSRKGELNSLTRREHQIGELLARGLSNKEIAKNINIEISTVKNHVHNILEKLHIKRRSEVANLFYRDRSTIN